MASWTLGTDVTIRDVMSTLTDKEKYTQVVLEHLMECQREHGKGNAHVRIGITGTGQVPSHEVVYDNPNLVETLFHAYAEQTRFTENIQINTWSSVRMSVDEVRALLGEMRGFRRPTQENGSRPQRRTPPQ